MIIGGSGSRKTKELLNLIKEQDDIDKIYFYVKDLSELKYEVLIKKREDAGTKHLNDSNAFIVRIQWMTFMKILMTKTQKKNLNCI